MKFNAKPHAHVPVRSKLMSVCIVSERAGLSNLFSKLGQILYRAEDSAQKAVCAESCSDFLSFVPKLS